MSDEAKRSVRVVNRDGFHARPCSDIVTLAKRFRSEVQVLKGDQGADARSVFDLMLLNVTKGDDLEVRACGPDARKAADAVADLIASGFGEDP